MVGATGFADGIADSDKASETFSQFVTRILDQLSLAAWLPAAALVMMTSFLVQLANVVKSRAPGTSGPSVVASLQTTMDKLAQTSLGGGLVLLCAIIVLTMVTQAFSFEAIRILEGYWGPGWLRELFADVSCVVHRRRLTRLVTHVDKLKKHIWEKAESAISVERAADRTGRYAYSPAVMDLARLLYFGGRLPSKVNKTQRRVADDLIDSGSLERYASARLVRRLRNVEYELRDFPSTESLAPTRLGNVLRHWEDDTDEAQIEPYVEEHFHLLPRTLQLTHDQRRTRLDLYCSMVVVVLLAGLIGVALFHNADGYPAAIGVIAVLFAWLNYRAAVSSARAYGPVLGMIVEYVNTLEFDQTS